MKSMDKFLRSSLDNQATTQLYVSIKLVLTITMASAWATFLIWDACSSGLF